MLFITKTVLFNVCFKIFRDRDGPKRLRQNSTSRPLSSINDLFDSKDFLFREKQDEVCTDMLLITDSIAASKIQLGAKFFT